MKRGILAALLAALASGPAWAQSLEDVLKKKKGEGGPVVVQPDDAKGELEDGEGEVAEVDSGVAAVDTKAQLKAYLGLSFDRSPARVLTAWTQRTPLQPLDPPKPGRPPQKFAEETTAFQDMVTRGEWQAVAEHLAAFDEDAAESIYQHLLAALSAPPGTKIRPGPDGKPMIQARPPGELDQRQVLGPADLRGLADAAPGELGDEALDLLGRLLATVLEQGHQLGAVLSTWRDEAAKLGGESPARRLGLARILLAAGQPREATAFLPAIAETEGAKPLALIVLHRLALHALEPEPEHLVDAWAATQRLLRATEDYAQAVPAPEDADDEAKQQAVEQGAALRQQALAWAVDLAPRVRDELGAGWLEAVFGGDATAGREALGSIGLQAALAREQHAKDPTTRLRLLRLQAEAVRALLARADAEAEDPTPLLTVLARNWLAEAELSLAKDTSADGGRPQPRYDKFGNLYFEQEGGKSAGNQPTPIPTVDVLAVRPDEAWRGRVAESLRVRLLERCIGLWLKAGDEDEAFPRLERLAQLPGQAERAHELAEELLRVWTHNHDLNASGQRRNRYVFWGFERRADAIPLTRSQQERNLAELGELLRRLRALPLEPLDEGLLAEAFIRSHSASEVYRLERIQQVFGPPGELEAKTLARLIQTMRMNLASLWRDPRVQKQQQTKRTDEQIQAEVARGYQVAERLARAGLEQHAGRWELLLADAALRFDYTDYQHREQGPSSEYAALRRDGYERFAQAAAAYAEAVPELRVEEERTDVYDVWFAASLGACDLPRLSHEHVPNPKQPARIKAALAALPGEASERHQARFANNLFARMSAVNPAVKYGYLVAGFEVVGDREEASEARKVFTYYQDLVTEIELVARLDGSDRVGHQRPFGVFVELRHTEQIERESGGFGRYLQNQNQVSYSYNFGRPTEDYRDKFEEATREQLGEQFDVRSITFADPKVESRGDPRPGWRTTPYAYVLLQARGPEVDEVPPMSLSLDFLDTSGYAVLPVESAPLPIDARPEVGDPRPLVDLEVTLSLDERRAGEGLLALEVQAQGHGLIPPLDDLLELDSVDAAFEIAQVDDPGVGAESLDLETQELAILASRRWLVELRGKQDLAVLPTEFTFPSLGREGQVLRQRYVDADLVEVPQTVALEADYGETASRWPLALLALVVLIVGTALARGAGQAETLEASGPFAPPEKPTPFAVLGLLQQIEASGALDDAARAELRGVIAKLEQAHFAPDGDPAALELVGVAQDWAARGNAAST